MNKRGSRFLDAAASWRELARYWLESAGGTADDYSPLPAAPDCRGYWRLLCRDRQRRAKLSYVYYEEVPGRRSAAKLLSKDEARRIAANIAKLPELLQRRAGEDANNG